MNKKILSVIGIALLSVMLITSCGSKGEKAQETNSKGNETKKVTIVTSGVGEPYSLLDDNNNWTGIDAEMWKEITKRKGWEMEIKRTAFEACFGELDSGRADLTANCWAIKDERKEKYYSSIPYYGDAQCLSVSKDNKDIKEFKDLKGKKVGVTTGQASETILQKMSEEYGFELVAYEETASGLQQLVLGRIDAMGGAVTTVNDFMHGTGEKVNILDEKLMANNVGFFFAKTEKGKELCEETNAVIKDMLADGTISKITEKWLYEDMTKLIIEDK